MNSPELKFRANSLYPIRSYSPLFFSSRRDVSPKRLYKVMRVAQKGGIQPGFGIKSIKMD